jgi:uncharacterized protein (AIM24 family)
MNWLGGGEGLFLATITGPGKVWLQTMPLSNLARKLAPSLGKQGKGSRTFGNAGDVLGMFK